MIGSPKNPPSQSLKICVGSGGFVLTMTHEEPQRQAGRAFGSHQSITMLLEVYPSSQCLKYRKLDRFALFCFGSMLLNQKYSEPLAFPPLNPTTSESILYPHFYQQISQYTKKQRCFMLRNQFRWQYCQKKERSKIP